MQEAQEKRNVSKYQNVLNRTEHTLVSVKLQRTKHCKIRNYYYGLFLSSCIDTQFKVCDYSSQYSTVELVKLGVDENLLYQTIILAYDANNGFNISTITLGSNNIFNKLYDEKEIMDKF